jgi:4-amino-4-deoxy-L-arabinose transferase-like glycosyltransferase
MGWGPKKILQKWFYIWVIVAFGFGLRILLVLTVDRFGDADEAVFGLMALHISRLKEFPVYCWEAQYAGALISYVAALIYKILGVSPFSLKLATFPFVAGIFYTTYALGYRLGGKAVGYLSLLWVALGPSLLNLYSVKVLGGYPETLFFGNLLLLLGLSLTKHERSEDAGTRFLWLMGFISGLAMWTLFMIIPYLVTLSLYLYKKRPDLFRWKNLFILGSSFVFGALPMVLYNIQHPMATFTRLGGRVLHVTRDDAGVKGVGLLVDMVKNYASDRLGLIKETFLNLSGLFGLPGQGWLAWLFSGLLVIFFARFFFQRDEEPQGHPGVSRHPDARFILASLTAATLGFAVLFGLDRSRHLFPLYTVLPVGLAIGVWRWSRQSRRIAAIAFLLLVAMNCATTIKLITVTGVPDMDALVRELETRGIRHIYTGYHIAYPVTFLSQEKIISSPEAGPTVTERNHRYSEEVENDPDAAYVFVKGSKSDMRFRGEMENRHVLFDQTVVDVFAVYDHFSSRLFPWELDLYRE